MQKLYSHESSLIIHNLKNLLEHEGITCYIKNDLISAGTGEVPPIEAWAEIWIENESDIEKAKSVIEKAVNGDPSKTSWFCEACSETNEPAFEVCWKCGNEACD